MDIFARISEPYQTLEGVLQSLANDCEKLVVYEHAGTRVHVHFYAVGMRIKTDALKVRIKKHLNVTVYDKTRWSFKTASDGGCITYMSKGHLDPVFVKGFSQDEIAECKKMGSI